MRRGGGSTQYTRCTRHQHHRRRWPSPPMHATTVVVCARVCVCVCSSVRVTCGCGFRIVYIPARTTRRKIQLAGRIHAGTHARVRQKFRTRFLVLTHTHTYANIPPRSQTSAQQTLWQHQTRRGYFFPIPRTSVCAHTPLPFCSVSVWPNLRVCVFLWNWYGLHCIEDAHSTLTHTHTPTHCTHIVSCPIFDGGVCVKFVLLLTARSECEWREIFLPEWWRDLEDSRDGAEQMICVNWKAIIPKIMERSNFWR